MCKHGAAPWYSTRPPNKGADSAPGKENTYYLTRRFAEDDTIDQYCIMADLRKSYIISHGFDESGRYEVATDLVWIRFG
jgi:hypothetical protein